MKLLSKNKSLIISILLAPLVPIICTILYIYINILEVNTMKVLITLFLIYLFVKLIQLIKQRYTYLFNVSTICLDWFLLDIVNLFTNNEFIYMKSSILETSLKLTLNTVFL